MGKSLFHFPSHLVQPAHSPLPFFSTRWPILSFSPRPSSLPTYPSRAASPFPRPSPASSRLRPSSPRRTAAGRPSGTRKPSMRAGPTRGPPAARPCPNPSGSTRSPSAAAARWQTASTRASPAPPRDCCCVSLARTTKITAVHCARDLRDPSIRDYKSGSRHSSSPSAAAAFFPTTALLHGRRVEPGRGLASAKPCRPRRTTAASSSTPTCPCFYPGPSLHRRAPSPSASTATASGLGSTATASGATQSTVTATPCLATAPATMRPRRASTSSPTSPTLTSCAPAFLGPSPPPTFPCTATP